MKQDITNNNFKNEFIGGIGWMGVSKLVTQTGLWIATIIIARLLTPKDYGLVGMVGLLVGIITLMGDFGLNSSIIQKKSISHKEVSALFWQFLFLGIFFTFLIYILAPFGCRFWGESELLNMIRLSAIIYLIHTLGQIPSALIQKEMKFREYGIILSIAAISGSVVSILLAFHGKGPYSLIFGSFSVAVVKLFLVFIYQPFLPQFVFITKETKQHLKFGATITIERYLWWYYSNCDFWLASKFLGKSMYGSYSMAFQLASLPIEKISSVVNPVALPAFSKIRDDIVRANFFLKILKYMAYLSFPIFLGFFWTADDLINLVLGEKWHDSILPFKMLALIFPLRCLATLNTPILNSIRRADIGVRNMLIGSIIATIVFVIGVQYGIIGLAYSWCFFYPVFFIIILYNVTRVIPISMVEYWVNLKHIIFNMGCMSLSIFLFQCIFNAYLVNNLLTSDLQVLRLTGTIITGVISFFLFIQFWDHGILKEIIAFFKK